MYIVSALGVEQTGGLGWNEDNPGAVAQPLAKIIETLPATDMTIFLFNYFSA